ncbi:hypothetical protein BC936DRAFT_149034 [Jimgerdemannia flammicorona]|uniref:Uncharacterized protein n=1 Tax=Jimgerdemannia flammicorona TaxID=994334 RepID=A0A433D1Q5_9FUNG|nr:hypothetical protein BC936DRAFT_149034 [Jimgerdemannia flammicorona]
MELVKWFSLAKSSSATSSVVLILPVVIRSSDGRDAYQSCTRCSASVISRSVMWSALVWKGFGVKTHFRMEFKMVMAWPASSFSSSSGSGNPSSACMLNTISAEMVDSAISYFCRQRSTRTSTQHVRLKVSHSARETRGNGESPCEVSNMPQYCDCIMMKAMRIPKPRKCHALSTCRLSMANLSQKQRATRLIRLGSSNMESHSKSHARSKRSEVNSGDRSLFGLLLVLLK